MKRILSLICAALMVFGTQLEAVNADSNYYTGTTDNHTRKDNPLIGITEEMNNADYWLDKSIEDSDRVLASIDYIVQTNADIISEDGNNVRNMEIAFSDSYDADALQTKLSNAAIPSQLYKGTEKIDNQTYFTQIKEAIKTTGYTGTQTSKYGICTGRVDMKDWPTNDQLVYASGDYDDDLQSAAMNVNEPFIIRAKCEINGQTFYWGYSTICSGWVSAENVAICNSKEEWIASWKNDITKDDFIVVTGSRINLDKFGQKTVQIMLGTTLKLVPDSEIPADLKDKAADNYIVYLPSKDANGLYYKEIAVLSKSLELNKGVLPYTERNILKLAFSCLGDEYGWGCSNGNMDCSGYTRQIYRCFGFELARNTTWQQLLTGRVTDISNMSDEQRGQYFDTLPTGTMLYFRGHTMVYLGKDNGKYYVISDLGTVYDVDVTFKTVRAVVVNSLDVLRGNKRTWLNNINAIVNMAAKIDMSACTITLSKDKYIFDGEAKLPEVNVSYNGTTLYKDINYTVEYADNTAIGTATVTVKGINNFAGQGNVTFAIEEDKPVITPQPEPTPEVQPEPTSSSATAKDTPVTGDDGLLYVYATLAVISLATSIKLSINSSKESKVC